MVLGLRDLYHRWLIRRHAMPDRLWRQALAASRYAQRLPRSERDRLRELATLFLAKKHFVPAAGLELTPQICTVVALKACVPILNLGLAYYRGWKGIVIYPGDFRVRESYVDENGIVHEGLAELCGQSLEGGPMVLSWESIEAESRAARGQWDLVVHECAHKLDALDGLSDGCPPLHADMDARHWTRAFREAYRRHQLAVARGEPVALDPYAATDAAEFFACTSEAFFSAPRLLREAFPAVYGELAAFYRQDPYALPHARPQRKARPTTGDGCKNGRETLN
jgi:Mlc titration factor MtfA (ptsG expression regulator)